MSISALKCGALAGLTFLKDHTNGQFRSRLYQGVDGEGVTNKTSLSNSFDQYLRQLVQKDGVVGAHLPVAVDSVPRTVTAENKLRAHPDAVCEAIMLIEAVGIGFLQQLQLEDTGNERLCRTAEAMGLERGIYCLQYGFSHSELKS